MSPLLGTRVGPYEIVSRLGAGGMGEVFRARDPRLGRDVAIKAMPRSFEHQSERLARFRREAQALASLNHPGIAAIYGLEEINGTPYLILELVAGETLAARLQRGPLPLRDAVAVCVQVAIAIEAAHEQGIVHRDLKPGNVMITPAGVVKVLDFGLARIDSPADSTEGDIASTAVNTRHDATEPGVILGTAAYMSPEQARGHAVDRRSDVWSFGCVLFECVSGRRAFVGGTASDVIAGILAREPEWSSLPAETPARLRDVLRRCLRKEVGSRPRDIRDVRVELTEIAAERADAGSCAAKSIAVLPFENLSGPDDEYFADGVTDEILNALTQLEGLRVAARTSCFAYKGRREDLRAIGEKLDVTTVLEGSVRRAGSRLRITVQLVNTSDGYQVWSERYDREMTDVFEVQEEIANAIASRLRVSLRGETERGHVHRGTRNIEAYELLLKGRALQNKRGRFLPEAIACFERAIALDPDYAEPMSWLADSYRLLGTFGAAPFAEVMPKAKRLAEQALSIDSGLTEAWATLAAVQETYEWDFEGADIYWERVFALDPRHSRGLAQRALWALIRGTRSAEVVLTETARAIQEDPLNAWIGAMHSYALGIAGRHEESLVEAERSTNLDPDSFFAHWNVMRAHAWAGHYDRAIEIAPGVCTASGRHPWGLGLLAWTFAESGQEDRARAVFDELEARSRYEFISPYWLATAASAAGLPDSAIRYVERAVEERDPLVVWGRVIVFWDRIRSHPRFKEIVQPVWR